jgi:hypothetical protein
MKYENHRLSTMIKSRENELSKHVIAAGNAMEVGSEQKSRLDQLIAADSSNK